MSCLYIFYTIFRLFEFRKIVSNREECYKLVSPTYPITITKVRILCLKIQHDFQYQLFLYMKIYIFDKFTGRETIRLPSFGGTFSDSVGNICTRCSSSVCSKSTFSGIRAIDFITHIRTFVNIHLNLMICIFYSDYYASSVA